MTNRNQIAKKSNRISKYSINEGVVIYRGTEIIRDETVNGRRLSIIEAR